MSKIIELEINKKYSELINVVGTYSFLEFNNINNDIDIDLIITTVPIAYNNIPIHTIDMNNLDRDLDNLNATISNYNYNNEYTKKLFSPQFFYIFNDNDNKNTILNFMTEQLINKNIVTTKFKDSVLLRESIASTCIGNNIAIPHPMELSAKKSTLSVGIIPDGIIWDGTEKINFIFLFAISKEDYENTQQI
ncbi:PTS sugar transporter subunit IIA [Vagococcus lutrae]|uniref:PTS sugar transporter subunit IIA n=1 Tax=Vagococcus lutrae TaxID=81947 RepID=UPI0020982F92|nr:PTS sugar transporter subunit IIA [Vagococcus lutrae]MCO7151492.1 PTS sugar transporter subunit IIA [Vagococcus lutrae]MDT2812503.1 PTS sugar transporter subunit IIA [Vagococcus lutrae]MDT2819467.1 PTS sugar transporter subunit IIA [Vagococcus lutrae]MDT2844324.1 PTS sugar transporter subunit IIA [Vagococcus lutrae]WCG04355.1 PTS sugar transporter subunit IIA [Vagococcus lutrae]